MCFLHRTLIKVYNFFFGWRINISTTFKLQLKEKIKLQLIQPKINKYNLLKGLPLSTFSFFFFFWKKKLTVKYTHT